MAGIALSEGFADFIKSTAPAFFSSVDKFVNEATIPSYTLRHFLRGKKRSRIVQSGRVIRDEMMFDEANSFSTYLPNEEITPTQPQVLDEIEIDWRFAYDHMSWTDHEVTLNMSTGYTRRYVNAQYKNLKKKLRMRMRTSIVNGLEAKLWADAADQQTEMEDSGGQEPLSIPAIITEDETNYHASNWTTIAGQDPATQTEWRNQVESYDYDDADDSDGDADGLIDAFDNMSTKLNYLPPGIWDEEFEGAPKSSDIGVFCSRGGMNQYKRLLRASNDTLVRKQDASYPAPEFDGCEVVYASQLDSQTLVWDPATSTTAATELNADPDGYRYFWINRQYLTPVFHDQRYFYMIPPERLEKQPWTWWSPVDIWYNVFPSSRRRHGIVAPQ